MRRLETLDEDVVKVVFMYQFIFLIVGFVVFLIYLNNKNDGWLIKGVPAEFVSFLHMLGAKVDLDGGGRYTTPLIEAVDAKDFAKIEILLRNGADINKVTKFGTALSWAASYCDTKMLEFLITKGANIDKTSSNLTNPALPALQAAINRRNLENVKFLLDKGAKTDNINGLEGP